MNKKDATAIKLSEKCEREERKKKFSVGSFVADKIENLDFVVFRANTHTTDAAVSLRPYRRRKAGTVPTDRLTDQAPYAGDMIKALFFSGKNDRKANQLRWRSGEQKEVLYYYYY